MDLDPGWIRQERALDRTAETREASMMVLLLLVVRAPATGLALDVRTGRVSGTRRGGGGAFGAAAISVPNAPIRGQTWRARALIPPETAFETLHSPAAPSASEAHTRRQASRSEREEGGRIDGCRSHMYVIMLPPPCFPGSWTRKRPSLTTTTSLPFLPPWRSP